MSARLVLHTTSACALCDRALALAEPIAAAFGWRLALVDVAEDEALFERYGERIPVLVRTDSGDELGWPFDARDLERFVSRARVK